MFNFVVAWLGGVVVSFVNGNRGLPLVVLFLGIVLVALTFLGIAGYFCLAGLAILAVIILELFLGITGSAYLVRNRRMKNKDEYPPDEPPDDRKRNW